MTTRLTPTSCTGGSVASRPDGSAHVGPPAAASFAQMRLPYLLAAPLAAVALLTAAAPAPAQAARVAAVAAEATIPPGKRAEYRSAGTWSALFDKGSLANRAPVLGWALALAVFGLVGAPYAWLAGSALPDRGYAFAKPLGLLLVGWLTWLGADTGTVPATRTGILLALVAVGAGAVAIVAASRRAFGTWVRRRWRVLVISEVVFWAFFAAALLVRWANPDLWHPARGGEKPMDFAFLNAVVKSEHFPPHDPWFADGVINYYYFGFVLAGTLVELTGVVPAVAYNLAVPTFYAFVAVSSYGAAAALAGRRRGWRSPVAAGVTGALLVAVVGNLAELRLLVQSLRETLPPEAWYWNASRAIGHAPTEPGPITEFPAFTFLFADLHAHALALPYTLVVVGLAAAAARASPRAPRGAGGVALLLLLALALGALWPLNTWDVPTYALVVLLALAVRRGAVRSPRAVLATGARWLAAVGLAWAAFAPFHLAYASSFAGFERWRGSRTALGDYVTVHGAFLLVVATALVVELAVARDAGAAVRGLRLAVTHPRRLRRLAGLHRALVEVRREYVLSVAVALTGVALAAGLALARLGVPALVAGLGTLTFLAAARDRRRSRSADTLWRLTLALFALGLALTLAVELAVAHAIDVGRMNTVFKLYLQVWTLWALAAAVAVMRVHRRLPRLGRPFRIAWLATVATLLAATLLYPALAVPSRIADRLDPSAPRTLDGTAFMRTAVVHERDRPLHLRYDLEAIRWLQRTVRGSPVIAEVNTFPMLYGWGSRYAVHTGNPTIVGWEWHERQQRSNARPGTVEQRVADVQRIYETTDGETARRLLARYDVRYVVVGELERAYFPGGSVKWADGEGRWWRGVYRNRGVTIYEPLTRRRR